MGQGSGSVHKKFFNLFFIYSPALGVKPAIEDVNARNFLAFCLASVEDQIELNYNIHVDRHR
jgi:hypothetical protein